MEKIAIKKVRNALLNNRWAVVLELLLVFGVVLLFLNLVHKITGPGGMGQQLAVWLANVLLLILVWLSQKIRGGTLKGLGLQIGVKTWRGLLKTVGLSVLVLVLALVAFQLGSLLASSVIPAPPKEIANTYEYLRENPAVFLLSLLGVYFVSSFGEELVYRAYLTHRILFLLRGMPGSQLAVVIISSVVFGLAHYQWGVAGIIQTTCMGLVFSSAYLLLGKRLPVLILAHLYMDTLLLASIYLA